MKGMNFEEFQNYIKDHIGEYLSEDYQDAEMKISHIKKTNGKDYEGLSVSRSGPGGILREETGGYEFSSLRQYASDGGRAQRRGDDGDTHEVYESSGALR